MSTDKRLLELALKGLEVERQRIELEIAAIQQRLEPKSVSYSESNQRKRLAKRSNLTPVGRKRLSDAMKARWASKNPPVKAAKRKAA
jgi:hypothetical protein